MVLFKRAPLPSCLAYHNCSDWARIYLSYCLCNVKDGVALVLGMVSIISWCIAEVPQIISNYKEKSTEGLSIAFLITWIVGDLFNLTGCLLEPSTLPTQYYVALLYTVTTVVLTAQTIYYGHIYHRLKSQSHCLEDAVLKENLLGESHKPDEASDYRVDEASHSSKGHKQSSPIPVGARVLHRYDSQGKDLYYMSARSLSKSPVPIAGSWLALSWDYGRSPPVIYSQQPAREPLLGRLFPAPANSATPLNTRNLLSLVPPAVIFLGVYILHICMNNIHNAPHEGIIISVRRKLLQDNTYEEGPRGIGTLLGWAMAAIYMGGRLPQICLNIRRGDVQGLNPLMFVFALTGNATYMGSILVKSIDWSKIRPNLPWLVDAGGCVLLDAFILIQFVYFCLRKHDDTGDNQT